MKDKYKAGGERKKSEDVMRRDWRHCVTTPAVVNSQTEDKGLLLMCSFSMMGRCTRENDGGGLTFLVPSHLLVEVPSMSSSWSLKEKNYIQLYSLSPNSS